MAEIRDAEDREHALEAIEAFKADYGAKWPKAVAKIVDDTEVLLSFFDFPAEHWIHLKTTNPIESTFATVRLRTKVTKGPGSKAAGLAMAYKAAYDDGRAREVLLRDLVEARRSAQLTQGAVAEWMGTTQSAVSELEGGVTEPRMSTLQRYARAVGCRVAAAVVPERDTTDLGVSLAAYHLRTALGVAVWSGRESFVQGVSAITVGGESQECISPLV